MTALPARRRDSLTPAFLAAVALHIALFAAVLLLSRPAPIPLGAAVPINIVSSAPTTDSRPAEAAPQVQAAQVETPVPEAKAPTPPPAPAQPVAAPAPAPVKRAKAKPTPAPTKPAPAFRPRPAKPAFSLDALQADIAKAARAQPARPAFAARGPTRAETAPVARVDAGQGVSQSDLEGLGQLLNRLWFKNCAAAAPVDVTVKLAIGDDGRVSRADAGGEQGSADPAISASAIRAVAAVHQAAPYAPEFRGKSFSVNFIASKACSDH
ncbi:MAG: energy transducer TonB [Caulobacteraceae bacterium]